MILRRRAALVLTFACVAVLVLAAMPLAAPARLTWAELDRWYLEVGPAAAAMSVLRLAGLLAAAWLVLVSALQLLAAGGARPHLTVLADRIAPRFLRSVACGAASLSLGIGLGGPAVAGAPPPSTAVMVPLDGPTTSTSPTTTTTAPAATTTTAPVTTATTTPPAATPPAPPTRTAPQHDEVVVEPGASFWSIAEDEAGGRDVGTYWRALIALNRERLVDPANPDLLYPGQVLRLP